MDRIPLVVWFLAPTIVIIVAGAWLLSSTNILSGENNPDVLSVVASPVENVEEFEPSGRNHISDGAAATNHLTNPPTSGDHWSAPANNGVYDKPLADQRVVHNLEHGYIWISYKQDTPADVIQNLKQIAEEDDWKIILSPRDTNDSQIALAAWGRLLNMNEPNYDKIKEFIKTYRNRGPEKTPS